MAIIDGRDEKKKGEFNRKIMPYLNDIYSAARRMAPNNQTAENTTALVFKEAWDCVNQISKETDVRVWLYCIFAGICLAGDWRQLRLGPTAPAPDDVPEDKSYVYNKLAARSLHQGNYANALSTNLTEATINNALGRMPVHIRLVIVLRDFQDLSYAEISQILGIPTNSVRLWVPHSRLLFQRTLWTQSVESSYLGRESFEESKMNMNNEEHTYCFSDSYGGQRKLAGMSRN